MANLICNHCDAEIEEGVDCLYLEDYNILYEDGMFRFCNYYCLLHWIATQLKEEAA